MQVQSSSFIEVNEIYFVLTCYTIENQLKSTSTTCKDTL